MSYEVVVSASVRRQLRRLPLGDAEAVLATLDLLATDARRMGKPLRQPWEGYFAARRGPYRLLYRVDDEERPVLVVRIEHRRDVYRRR